MRHLKTLDDLTADDVAEILERSAALKSAYRNGDRPDLLRGRVLSLLFEKPSLRTRVSFEAAMTHLGGGSLFQSTEDAGLNGRESLPDVTRVLSGFCDAIVLRTFSQTLVDEFASLANCPVINGLSDDAHPCQALTDLFTIREVFGELTGRKLVFIGDGNNVARSLTVAAALTGLSLTICTPAGYRVDAEILSDLRARVPTADITETNDPHIAVADAEIIYTDVWASMGQESEAAARRADFAPFQVDAALMARAPSGCKFMHDLPAHRGEEVTDDVIDGPASIVFQQAENRMHLAKGLLVWLLDA